jgi:hypothetical protein
MNKVDPELEQFMKALEKDCHKYKRNNIEWSPYSDVWLCRRWLLVRITYLLGKTRDPRNLLQECRKKGLAVPCMMTQDEFNAEFLICKENLEHLAKHGPRYCRQFLKRLVSSAKIAGNSTCASKITGILHKEANKKQWLRMNRTTKKARGGLMIAIKVPMSNGGVDEFKMKDGVLQAMNLVLVEQFQSALAAKCYCGSFFDNIRHLADCPTVQQILEGT